MSSSTQFQLQIIEQPQLQIQKQITQQHNENLQPIQKIQKHRISQGQYGQNHYKALSSIIQNDNEQKQKVLDLQSIIKTQYLLLQYEQKRKSQRLKEIQYSFTNAYNNYLWSRPRFDTKSIIATSSDLMLIHQNLPDQIQILKNSLFKFQQLGLLTQFNVKPPQSFMNDFFNYYPNWHKNVTSIIKSEVDKSLKLENVFQSQYSFPSKILSSLRENAQIQRFCYRIFKPVLRQLKNTYDQLCIDFISLYEKWLDKLQSKIILKQFFQGNSLKLSKQTLKQLQQLLGQKFDQKLLQQLIPEIKKLNQNQQQKNKMLQNLNPQEMQQLDIKTFNFKLGYLVKKKIQFNLQKIQMLSSHIIQQIIKNTKKFPSKIKYIVQQWKRLVQQKFKLQFKFQDVRSFFVKVIYSQLLFAEFMALSQQIQGPEKGVKNFNITMLALISQKIMFGQQFYDKHKFAYFNKVISQFEQDVRNFIHNFAQCDHVPVPKPSSIQTALISFQTIKFLYPHLVTLNKVKILPNFEKKMMKNDSHIIGASSYQKSNIYIVMIAKPTENYCSVFKPKQKIKRTIIQFLLSIQRISQPVPFLTILEQYKTMDDTTNNTFFNQNIQLYANYLSLLYKKFEKEGNSKEKWERIFNQIIQLIQSMKKKCQDIKFDLQKQLNYSQNLQRYFMQLLTQKKKDNSKKTIKKVIQTMLTQKAGFSYQIIQNKVCQVNDVKKQKSLKGCLFDIGTYFRNRFQGTDGLFHLALQKLQYQIQQQGVVDQNTIQAAKQILGTKLYKIINLNQQFSELDQKILKIMKAHSFIDLKILQMKNLFDQQDLILELCQPILKQFLQPASPNFLLKLFHQITLVFQNIILTTGKASDINADVQIPLMLFILIKSQLPNLSSILDFIQHFASDQITSGAYGQTLTLVKSAMYLIQTMDAKKLNISQQKYQQYLVMSSPGLNGKFRIQQYY